MKGSTLLWNAGEANVRTEKKRPLWQLSVPDQVEGRELLVKSNLRIASTMKPKAYFISAVVVAAGVFLVSGCVHDSNSSELSDRGSQNYGHLTGSYVPQDVQRSGPVTNGKSNVRVIDNSDIDRSGGANVSQTLRQLGANH